MATPIISEFTLNESILHKASACDKIRQVMDFDQNNSSTASKGMVRTASCGIDQNNIIELFASLSKTKVLKERYHQEVIKVSAVKNQIKTILDGVISEIEIKKDSLGTTVNRNPYDNNSN